MKIRIFALAKELGLDSKELIEYAAKAGVQVKNSALASISPEERDAVLDYINTQRPSASDGSTETVAPSRETAPELTGKVRTIKTLAASRPQNGRSPATRQPEAAPKIPEAAVQKESPDGAAAASRPAAREEAPAPADTAPRPVDAAAKAPELQPPKGDQGPTADSAKPEPKSEPAPEGGVVPISRDDYVSARGLPASAMREMKPRGTIPDADARQARRPKGKAKPALPNVAAAPTYKPPKPRAPEKGGPPAQKPDIPLTPDILEQQSPLRAHLQQQKKKKKGVPRSEQDVREAIRRGGKAAPDVEEKQRRQKQRRTRGFDEEAERRGRLPRRAKRRPSGPIERKTSAQVTVPTTVRGLSEAMGRPARDLLSLLFRRGQMTTINEVVDEETALELALELGVDLEIKRERTVEDELVEILEREDPEETLAPRAPMVTILGHVDHGKTTLLDMIRSAHVAAGEAGGITQHIAAYQVDRNGQKITFVDTPGHAAFGEMRARGAGVTDIVVLVVAADDGVMPQTVECISHAKVAKVPIVVALNKIDLPETNEQKVLQELAAQDILPAEWGGDVEVVRTSAISGQGIDNLLETLLVTAELQEYKASPERPALGVCLEAFMDEGRGPLAWLVVQKGTLRVGDIVLCGTVYGRVRSMYNDRDEEIAEAGPSTPVKIAGLERVPDPGEHFFVLEDLEKARRTAEERFERGRVLVLATRGRPRTLEDILTEARGGKVQDLPIIVKADTPGSLEALRHEIEKFEHPELRVEFVHQGIGGVNESDVSLAHAAGAIIIAFHVIPEERAEELAQREGVQIRRYQIIYEVIEDIKRVLEGMLAPERVEVTTGRALVLRTFDISRFGRVAGCRVLNGTIERTNRIRVVRDQTILNDYDIASLKREKDDVREVREGMECGILLQGFNDVKEGDLLESYRIDTVKRTLD